MVIRVECIPRWKSVEYQEYSHYLLFSSISLFRSLFPWKSQMNNAKFAPHPTCFSSNLKSCRKKKKKKNGPIRSTEAGINTRFNLHDVRSGKSFSYQISSDETFETLRNRSVGFWWNHDRGIVRVTNVRQRSHRWNSMGCLLHRDRWFIALAFKQIRMFGCNDSFTDPSFWKKN